MLIRSGNTAGKKSLNRCLSCGTTENVVRRRYCSLQCRQNLRQKLNTRTGLLQALNTRYATFYFSDTSIIMDIVPHGIREVFRFCALRSVGKKPAEDFSRMTNMLGSAWWAEEKITKKYYLASLKVLELAQRCPLTPPLMRPRLVKIPTVKPEALSSLNISKADLQAKDLIKVIKNAYRREAKIHHPDLGGQAATFRRLHIAYRELLQWAENPTFIRRRGLPDKWYYDSDNKKWVQPIPARK